MSEKERDGANAIDEAKQVAGPEDPEQIEAMKKIHDRLSEREMQEIRERERREKRQRERNFRRMVL